MKKEVLILVLKIDKLVIFWSFRQNFEISFYHNVGLIVPFKYRYFILNLIHRLISSYTLSTAWIKSQGPNLWNTANMSKCQLCLGNKSSYGLTHVVFYEKGPYYYLKTCFLIFHWGLWTLRLRIWADAIMFKFWLFDEAHL